ncbi:MAG: alpha/beta fold hydrolase [Actinophytocola sp.]|uniref:alpha/beta fold hydrolase n=1 Tax=Actinophytocola sp. TaxID=1872138 RepID=UPI0013247C3B|nr:alpha/beta hydrolase [Actinophytocola sp.]MPZ82149.1 alpha/beta fold hydrolase [Actinophytocola sp.]
MTSTIISADGTKIAYERSGDGPPLIIVDGAMCYRDSGPARPMAAELAGDFTVFIYDRRGRGESGESSEIALEREIEDVEALAKEAGGSPFVYGPSSGAMLALEAANHGIGVSKLAMYEAPLIVDDSRVPIAEDFLRQITTMVEAGRNGDAVKAFMRSVEVPGFAITMMRLMPVWSKLKTVAPTLRYDFTVMQGLQQGRPLPETRWSTATMPTLVVDGGKSPAWMRNGNEAMADVLPNATYRTLPGQNHLVKAKALAPWLKEFFTA